jgi:hypothetical protein
LDPAVFNNREFRIRAVKTNKNEDPAPTVDEILHPDSVKLIEETGRRFVKYLAATVVAVVVVIKVADTLGDIAVKKTKSADQD